MFFFPIRTVALRRTSIEPISQWEDERARFVELIEQDGLCADVGAVGADRATFSDDGEF